MTSDMMEMYQSWLWNRGIRQNTVAFYLRTLRTLYNKAVEAGQAPSNDIFSHIQTANARTGKRAISVNDIRKIEKLNLSRGSSLDKARDLFLLSFYLRGMAFVDMAFLKKSDLKCGMISYSRRKTHQNLNIEWIRCKPSSTNTPSRQKIPFIYCLSLQARNPHHTPHTERWNTTPTTT